VFPWELQVRVFPLEYFGMQEALEANLLGAKMMVEQSVPELVDHLLVEGFD
jgi:hypothetical protein